MKKKIRLQLHEVLYGTSFVFCMAGAAAADSDLLLIPGAMFLAGLLFLLWGAREDGWNGRRKK